MGWGWSRRWSRTALLDGREWTVYHLRLPEGTRLDFPVLVGRLTIGCEDGRLVVEGPTTFVSSAIAQASEHLAEQPVTLGTLGGGLLSTQRAVFDVSQDFRLRVEVLGQRIALTAPGTPAA